MIGRIVEVAEDDRHLSRHRGFLVVTCDGEELGRVPLDDIAAVITNAHGLTYSNNLLVALAERRVPVVLCASNHRPAAFVWTTDGHHEQAGRMADQAAAKKPLKKRLWQQLVSAKIRHQAATLKAVGQSATGFELLARKVRSGDPENVEAQAARRYWPLLFGEDFRRDPSSPGRNGLLNYGYAIVRAAAARAIMASGLHPSLSLHHSNRGNAFCLIDDVMEPFRPTVDLAVFRLVVDGVDDVTRDAKRALADLAVTDLRTDQGATPLITCLERLGQSLAKAYANGSGDLALPVPRLPLER